MNDLKAFRQALGQFATGVTVVTCSDRQGKHCGITANSFSSVSLEPPLLLWNIAKSSNSLQAYLEAENFAVNVLEQTQKQISTHFAQSNHQIFDGIDFSLSESGAPILPGTLACFECKTLHTHDSGDHYIIIGEVERFTQRSGKPLLFFAGHYAVLGDDSN